MYIQDFDRGIRAGGFTKCNIITQTPTTSPTQYPTKYPTKSPTPGRPQIYLYMDLMCSNNEGSCECNIDANDEPIVDCSGSTTTTVRVSEAAKIPYTFSIYKFPKTYFEDITLTWELVRSGTNPANMTDFEDIDNINQNDGKYFGTSEQDVLVGSKDQNNEISVDYEFTLDQDDLLEGEEQIAIRISACSSNYGCGFGGNIVQEIILIISDDSNGKKLVGGEKSVIPEWVWYAIAAGVLFLVAVGYLLYRRWANNKLLAAEVDKIDAELDELDAQGGIDDFGGIGDEIIVNPLATGIPGATVPTSGDMIDDLKAEAKRDMVMAQTEVEQVHFRSEFAQVQADSRGDVV